MIKVYSNNEEVIQAALDYAATKYEDVVLDCGEFSPTKLLQVGTLRSLTFAEGTIINSSGAGPTLSLNVGVTP